VNRRGELKRTRGRGEGGDKRGKKEKEEGEKEKKRARRHKGRGKRVGGRWKKGRRDEKRRGWREEVRDRIWRGKVVSLKGGVLGSMKVSRATREGFSNLKGPSKN